MGSMRHDNGRQVANSTSTAPVNKVATLISMAISPRNKARSRATRKIVVNGTPAQWVRQTVARA